MYTLTHYRSRGHEESHLALIHPVHYEMPMQIYSKNASFHWQSHLEPNKTIFGQPTWVT